VILDGERWLEGSLRPAVDELLGAGAMIHHLTWHCSPEAQVARDAFRSAAHDLTRSIRDSISGRKFVGRGFLRGVDMALEVDVSECAPLLRNDAYRAT
jgi:2-phosphosulfolactate phosphatase